MSDHAQMTDAAAVRDFVLAGRAAFTLVSQKTGTRFTFRVVHREGAPHFVQVLTGPENTSDYTFLGTIFTCRDYRHGRKSTIREDATSTKAFAWAWSHLVNGAMPPSCEIWHQGKCGRCGRALTVPESVEMGLGPECAQKAAA